MYQTNPVFSQTNEGVVVDEIIGRVDDYIVLRSELESTYLEILSRGERISGNTKCAVLKDLVTNNSFKSLPFSKKELMQRAPSIKNIPSFILPFLVLRD